MSERVYDRLVGVDAEGNLPPVVAQRLRGEPGAPGGQGPAGVSIDRVERTGTDAEAKAVVHLTDDTAHEVDLPRGPQGVSVVSVQGSTRPGYLRVGLSDGTSSEVPAQPRLEWSREAQARVQGYWEVVSHEEPEAPTFELSDGTVLPVKWTRPVTRNVPVFPEPPAFDDFDGTVSVAPLAGVRWQVKGGPVITPGEWVKVAPEQLPGDVTVEAVALPGYELLSRAEWTHSYPSTQERTVWTSETFDRTDSDELIGQSITTDAALGGTPMTLEFVGDYKIGSDFLKTGIRIQDQQIYFPHSEAGSKGWAGLSLRNIPDNWGVELDLTEYTNVRHGQTLSINAIGYGTKGTGNLSVQIYHVGSFVRVQATGTGISLTTVVNGRPHDPQLGHYAVEKFRRTLTVTTPYGSGALELPEGLELFTRQGTLNITRGINQAMVKDAPDDQVIRFDNLKITGHGF